MKKKMIAMSLGLLLLLNGCGAALFESSKTGEMSPVAEPTDDTVEYSTAESDVAAEFESQYDIAYETTSEEMISNYQHSGESYLEIDENQNTYTAEQAIKTLSLKVDTASYTNVARFINYGNLPPMDAVKTEELLNYFNYDNEIKDKEGPFSISTEIATSPYNDAKKIALLRVKTEEVDKEDLPPSNLTFLLDTSGSMEDDDKLPLLKKAFSLLVETLDEDDRVSIVTYAGSSGVVLDSASGANKNKILRAIKSLSAGGSTYGEGGIQTAYALAEKNFIEGGNNRVILATDGDFNVGISTPGGLEDLISEKCGSGINLSVLGFGTGNLQDANMETLSKHGDGNYSYIGSVKDAEKVLVDELGSNLFTVASDVKAQVEFNPETVSSYRLIGYENRVMANEDFEDDTKDAGEIGAGTDVVMMFELEMANNDVAPEDELFELRIRYKDPGESESKEITKPALQKDITDKTSKDFNFACAVAGFSHLLRDSDALGNIVIQDIEIMARKNKGDDKGGYRGDFVELVQEYHYNFLDA